MADEENGSHIPQMIPVQPVPMNFTLNEVADSEGNKHIQLIVSHMSGVFIIFMDPDGASQIGKQLLSMARQASISGLVIPMPKVPRDIKKGDK